MTSLQIYEMCDKRGGRVCRYRTDASIGAYAKTRIRVDASCVKSSNNRAVED